MKNNAMYLIRHNDYVKHIGDCVVLCDMLEQLCDLIRRLPVNRGSKELSEVANAFREKANAIMDDSGIPASYLVFGDERCLLPLMEKELTAVTSCCEENIKEEHTAENEIMQIQTPRELLAYLLGALMAGLRIWKEAEKCK